MKINSKYFKSQRKTEIRSYLQLIDGFGIKYKTVDYKDNLDDSLWGYNVTGLVVPAETSSLKHIRPSGFTNLEVVLEIDVTSNVGEWEQLTDPFTCLNFRSLLRGTNSTTGQVHYLSFHVDRHNGTGTTELHPLYHLQYLQNANVKPKDEFNHGESLQLDVPRMMHFPMELVLGVNFIVSNFAPKIYNQLIQERQYVKLCAEYQQRVWRPYINSLESFWSNPRAPIWDPKLNCPYLT